MKFLKKLKSGNFWISLISAGVLIAEGIFDFEIKTEYLNQILLGLMGILTLFGIVTDHGDTSVILNSANNEVENKEEKNETVNTSVSNIKSICDTVSLLLNKVSINSNLDIENVADIINEVKEINEVLHKETEKAEKTNHLENGNEIEEHEDAVIVNEPQKVETDETNNEIIVEEIGEKIDLEVKPDESVKNPIQNDVEEISIVNN